MSASAAASASAAPGPGPASTQPRNTLTPSEKLEDQAASAALYVVRDTSSRPSASASSILDNDGRLSSASAALSLKYARAQDLPSFPSAGGVKLASASAAASLAESNKKQFEHWTPGVIPAANKAANRAKDYEMEPVWKPELSRAGSHAAMVAHKDTAPVEIWKAPETEHGSSAASSALQNQKSPPPITERQVSNDGRQKALLAATASMSGGRRRAESAPMRPQPPTTTSAWALKAATSSQNMKPPASPSTRSTSELSSLDAARVQNMAKNNVSRQMYTSNPPVSIEVEEKKRQDMLRASAVAMAKKMFAIQQAQIDEARGIHRSESHYAAYAARRRAQSDAAKPVPEEPPPRYENLEDAARRLAQDRLAKLHDEHAEYRQYYGQQPLTQRSRLTLRRGRRTSNLQDDSDSDEEQSRKIRTQMSLFQSKLAEVDTKKRQADRDALLAAAHKNVTARMNAMDEKVFSETGKTSPQQRELWERQARERAQRESDDRLINVGKVHIGGGKYLEQSEIDAIAKARLQPTLDEITQKAEDQRAKDEEMRLEQERIKAEQAAEKQRQADIKAEQKAVVDREKAEQRAQKAEEKKTLQDQKHEERRVRTEQKAADKKARDETTAAEKERRRTEKDEKRQSEPGKSRLLPTFFSRGGAGAGAAAGAAAAAVVEGTSNAAEGGARVVTSAAPATGTAKAEDDEPVSDTIHEPVTMDPSEAAYAVAAADAEDARGETEESTDVVQPAGEDVEPKDSIGATPYSSAEAPADTTSPASPMSPVSATSPSKRDSRVRSFFKRFRTGSKAENDYPDSPNPAVAATTESEAIAPTAETEEPIHSFEEEERGETDSVRHVAMAGRGENESDDMYGGSTKPDERVSPVQAATEPGHDPLPRDGEISSLSDKSSSLGEEPYVIAADVASSKYSAEQGSKRDSGVDQLAALSDTDSEPRGRKGFRERFLKKVIPGRDKEKPKSGLSESTTVATAATATTTAAPTTTEGETTAQPHTAPADDDDENLHANPDPQILSETEPLREKIQEPSTTSTEATVNTTVTGATTPALTHTQTNGDDDDDFEEARDTFDEGRLVSASKVEGGARLVDVSSPTSKKSGEGERTGGSRFTEEL